jgi:nucleotide-binding universal stress UspA family protein
MQFLSILVPVKGTEADEEAIKLACRLAKPDKAKICAVNVIPIDRTLPLDAEMEGEVDKAEAILNRMEDVAREQGYSIDTDLLQARGVGPTIVGEAAEREADLVLIGVEYKKQFGQFSLGTIVPHILKNAPCRVLLYHQYSNPSEVTE